MIAASSRPTSQAFQAPASPTIAISTARYPTTPNKSPTNNNPAAPNTADFTLPLQSRQLHAPRNPLYRPAVLRAPDPPVRRQVISPPVSTPSSLHSSTSSDDIKAFHRRNNDLCKVQQEEWAVEDDFGKVTGPPRRDHWKVCKQFQDITDRQPDSDAPSCDHPMCTKRFSLFDRRHHCRRCGKIYCGEHSAHQLLLDQDAGFHPFGTVSRGCDVCYHDFRAWTAAMRSGSSSSGESSIVIGSPITPRSSWGVESPNSRTAKGALTSALNQDQKVGSVVGSVPRDWNWSTF
jgi:hypothetical protein